MCEINHRGSCTEKFVLTFFHPFQKGDFVIFEENHKIFLLALFKQVLQKFIMGVTVLIAHFLHINIHMISEHQIQQLPVVLVVPMNFHRQFIS